jgi:hypothetical protein
MNAEQERIWKVAVVVYYFKNLSPHSAGNTDQNSNTQRYACRQLTEVQIEYLQSTYWSVTVHTHTFIAYEKFYFVKERPENRCPAAFPP